MGHATTQGNWQEAAFNTSREFEEFDVSQLRQRRHSIPWSARSSTQTEYSARTGSTNLEIDSFEDDRDSWRNTLTFDNTGDSQEDIPFSASRLTLKRNRQQPTEKPSISCNKKSLQLTLLPPESSDQHDSSEIEFPVQNEQSHSNEVLWKPVGNKCSEIPKATFMTGHRKGENQPPKLPLRRAPSLPAPKSAFMTLQLSQNETGIRRKLAYENQPVKLTKGNCLPRVPPKPAQEMCPPPVPPKPVQEIGAARSGKPAQDTAVPTVAATTSRINNRSPFLPNRNEETLQSIRLSKPNEENSQPFRSVKPNEESLLPARPPKPNEGSLQPFRPPKPNEQCSQPFRPPKPNEQCLQPFRPPKPNEQCSQPFRPQKPNEQCLQPIRPPKPNEESLQPVRPSKPNEEGLQSIRPSKPNEESLEPFRPPKPNMDYLQLLDEDPSHDYLEPMITATLPPRNYRPQLPSRPAQQLQDAEPPKRQDTDPSRRQDTEPLRRQDPEPPRRQDPEPPRRQDVEPPRRQDVELPRRQDVEPPRRQDVEPPRRQDPELPTRGVPLPLSLRTPTMTSTSDDEETSASNAPLTPPILTPYRHASSENSRHSHRRPHFLIQRRNLITISLLSFMLSMASAALLILVLVNPFSYRWQERTFKEGAYKTCVKCVYLMNRADVLYYDDIRILTNEPHDGEMHCCAETSSQMSALLKLILKQQEYKPSQVTGTDAALPAAQKRLNMPTEGLLPILENHYLLPIFNGSPSVEYSSTVTIKNNGLVVAVSGWYYVYSNIMYAQKCNELTTGDSQTMEHSISIMSPLYRTRGGRLVKTTSTCCTNCSLDMTTSFAGGIFELYQGDQIIASVTRPKAVQYDTSTYLGLVMLGTQGKPGVSVHTNL